MRPIRKLRQVVTTVLVTTAVLFLLSRAACGVEGSPTKGLELTTTQVAKEKRIALVMGNAAYGASPLKNPGKDALAVSAALQAMGFEVTTKVDVRQDQLKQAIDEFGRKLRNADVGLFFYSGHGLQVHGANYIVPIGAKIEGEGDVEYEAVDVGRVLGKMEDARCQMNIVILDACRNNPFKRSFRSQTQGLAFMHAPAGTVIAYATAPDSVADDGPGENGVYTGLLVKVMQEPGLKIEDVFKKVRAGVREETHGNQVPWESVSLEGDFYFNRERAPSVAEPSINKPKEPSKGRIFVKCDPAEANVKIVDSPFPYTPGMEIDPGKYKLEISKQGYETLTKEVEVENGARVDLLLALKAAPTQGVGNKPEPANQPSSGGVQKPLPSPRQSGDVLARSPIVSPLDAVGRIQDTVKSYYDFVQRKNIDNAIGLFSSTRQPEIQRAVLQGIAKDTQYFRIDSMKPVKVGAENANVLLYIYHKKFNQPEEYWEINVSLVKEKGEWKIVNNPGRKIK